MKKVLTAVGAAVACAVLLGSLPSPTLAGPPPEWKEVKEEALKVFANPESSPGDRLEAMMKVGAVDCREAVDLLVKWCRSRTAEEAALAKASGELEKKIQDLYDRNKALLKKNQISRDDAMEIAKLNKDLSEVNSRIVGLTQLKRKTSEALAKCASQVEYMVRSLKEDDWQVRAEVVQALAAIGTEPALEGAKAGFRDADYKVRSETVELLLTIHLPGGEEAVMKALEDDWWQVRSIAVKVIREKRMYKAIGALIQALQCEDGRLAMEMDAALEALTGKTYYGDASLWARWWATNKDKILQEVAEGKTPEIVKEAEKKEEGHKGAMTTSFYGIETASKRIIFVLDHSGSMQQVTNPKAGGAPAPPPQVTGQGADEKGEKKDDGGDRFKPKDNTRIEIAKSELKKAIAGLPEDASFTIIFYHHEIEVYSPTMIAATKAAKEKAYAYIDGKTPAGNTNIHDALKAAFDIKMPDRGVPGGGGGAQVTGGPSARKADKGGADTIFFLTDGKPTTGKIMDPAGILAAVATWNETRRIQIHCIGIGDQDAEQGGGGGGGGRDDKADRDFLRKLAEQNGGTYVGK
jgi:hypothetical protein